MHICVKLKVGFFGVWKLTTELTNEQIVTNLLIKNEFLKPVKGSFQHEKEHDLGKFLSEEIRQKKELQKLSRYTFIDVDNGWNF